MFKRNLVLFFLGAKLNLFPKLDIFHSAKLIMFKRNLVLFFGG